VHASLCAVAMATLPPCVPGKHANGDIVRGQAATREGPLLSSFAGLDRGMPGGPQVTLIAEPAYSYQSGKYRHTDMSRVLVASQGRSKER